MNKEIQLKIINDIGIKRFEHSVRVKDIAVELAIKNNIDIQKTCTAAIFHDCGKIIDYERLFQFADEYGLVLDDYMKKNPELIHASLGARIAQVRYNINDTEVLNAIKYHTTGREDMSMLEKIIYISDYIEPKRSFPGVQNVRDMAFKDINESVIMAMEMTTRFLTGNKKMIHPDTLKSKNKLIIEYRR